MSYTKQPQIFLAHASEDKGRVRDLYHKLCSAGFKPWLDVEDLIPGQNWRIEVPRAIKASDIFVACLSDCSVQKQGYVQKEFRLALDLYAEKPPGSVYVIPVKFDDCQVPDFEVPQLGVNFGDIHWLELWREDGFERLIRAIENALGIVPKEQQAKASKDREGPSQHIALLLSGGKYQRKFQIELDNTHSLVVSNSTWGMHNVTHIEWDGKQVVDEVGIGYFSFAVSDGTRDVTVGVKVDWSLMLNHLQRIKVEVDGNVLYNEGDD